MASTTTAYTYAQLEQLWINNGGSRATAPIAAAIALAESGGNAQATNPTDNNGTQTSWGLWQVSNGTHAQPVANVLDPNVNAQQAVAKYNAAGGWSPWGTYDSGAYKAFLSPGTTPDANVPAGTATLTAATTTGTSTCAWSVPLAGCVMSNEGARVLLGGACLAAAGIIGLAGAVVLAAGAFQHPAATKAVSALAPVGATVRAVTRRRGDDDGTAEE